jgi:hypothetical protein
MRTTFKMEGVSMGGQLYVLESDCRRTVNEAMDVAKKAERERCAQIALAIDSKRGNEKEIARAIREQTV